MKKQGLFSSVSKKAKEQIKDHTLYYLSEAGERYISDMKKTEEQKFIQDCADRAVTVKPSSSSSSSSSSSVFTTDSSGGFSMNNVFVGDNCAIGNGAVSSGNFASDAYTRRQMLLQKSQERAQENKQHKDELDKRNAEREQLQMKLALAESLHRQQQVFQKPKAIENEPDAEKDEKRLCCVCSHRKSVATILPCAHLCLCVTCSQEFTEQSKCPMCRGEMNSILKVYF